MPGGGGGEDTGESWISSFLCINVVTKIEMNIIAGSEVGDIGYTVLSRIRRYLALKQVEHWEEKQICRVCWDLQ